MCALTNGLILVPMGTYASTGEQTIPEEYASQIPSIAFTIPDLDGNVKMTIKDVDTDEEVGCVESIVGNGKTLTLPSVSYIAAGIAMSALAVSALGALLAGGQPGVATSSPSFVEVVHWFQGMAMNGMMSVDYPRVYQSFTTNFAFSTGLVPWSAMQNSIDGFRKATGGNLTQANYEWLVNNASLTSDSSSSSNSLLRRAVGHTMLYIRDETSVTVNGTEQTVGDGESATSTANAADQKESHVVSGIQRYVELLRIPSTNTFMTVLLVWAIVVATIIVLILLAKVILEGWAMCGTLNRYFESWRKRYWLRMAKAIVNLILLLYGVWTLYCIYQFTNGDSWAAKLLAGVTLAVFTAVLVFFTWRIWTKAREFKRMDGDTTKLFEDKNTWVKYSLFYDTFKRNYWIFFVPAIFYMFAKGCVIAGANGHGLAQVGGQLIVEAIMLGLLLWTRPYQLKSGRWINIVIHVVRVLSVVCILVFVEEMGISQTTKTITGVILIVVQCVLTGILAILIAVNAIIIFIKENPHRRRRKEAEKLRNGDLDTLTPLDAHNSLLMGPMSQRGNDPKLPVLQPSADPYEKDGYSFVTDRPDSPYTDAQSLHSRTYSKPTEDQHRLVSHAAGMGHQGARTGSFSSSPPRQQPQLPNLDFGFNERPPHAR